MFYDHNVTVIINLYDSLLNSVACLLIIQLILVCLLDIELSRFQGWEKCMLWEWGVQWGVDMWREKWDSEVRGMQQS